MSNSPVRVFIGSGEASVLERKTLIHSLRKHTRRPLDITVFNGTHNALERNDDPPVLAPMSLRVKYRNFTEFTLYRFLIPQLCNHEGRAIFLDSDIVCLADIGELFDMPMNGAGLMCIKAYDTGQWGPSVLLFDCAQCRFDLEQIVDEIDAGKYTYSEFTRFAETYLALHPHAIGELDQIWNSFDRHDETTKLIHYTNLMLQPWKYPGHPYAALWLNNFREAVESGFITEDDIHKATCRGYARHDIRQVSQHGDRAKGKGKRPHWLRRLPQKLLRSA